MTGGPALRRVLQVHTRYREPGGEDAVVEAERRLLEGAGISVEQVIFDNAELREGLSVADDLRLARDAVWSSSAQRRVRRALRASGAQVVHVHNTFAAASPSVFQAAAEFGVPVVQTLHNYRLVCPAATVFRDGHPCTDCVGRPIPWPGVVHACVRGSRRQSLVAAAMATFHRARGTFRREVDCYLALTEFQRRLLLEGGLPASKVRVIPNFLGSDPGPGGEDRDGIVFVGRLSVEKGLGPLMEAAAMVPGRITIVGDGPMRRLVERAAADGTVTYRGPLGSAAVFEALRTAVALACPSIWFEGMPMVLLEAFATATPVIASRIGSLENLVDDERTGLLVPPGDAGGLAAAVRSALDRPDMMALMGQAARRRYESEYGAERHLRRLLDAYSSVMRHGSATD